MKPNIQQALGAMVGGGTPMMGTPAVPNALAPTAPPAPPPAAKPKPKKKGKPGKSFAFTK